MNRATGKESMRISMILPRVSMATSFLIFTGRALLSRM